MADTVRYLMEEMVPELDDLERKGYFSKTELKQIVKKRTDFEYCLKRRAPEKLDYLRYIEYERKVDRLRRQRRKIRGITGKKTLADYAGVRRIHFIYERATRKWRADLSIWSAWLDYCRYTRSTKQTSRILTRALQIHPTCVGLWSQAAAFEFEVNGNPDAARALMQRGLRVNDKSEALWVDYFRFELHYAERLRARRAVLGIAEGPAEGGAAAGGEGAADESEEAVRAVLEGLVALVVYKNACKALPSSVAFRRKFLTALEGFDLPGAPRIRDEVYTSIQADLGSEPEAWDVRARRHTSDADACLPGTPGYRAATAEYESGAAAVAEGGKGRLAELHVCFLEEVIAGANEAGNSRAAKAAAADLRALVGRLAKEGPSSCPESVWLAACDVAEGSGDAQGAVSTARSATEQHGASVGLWARRIALEFASLPEGPAAADAIAACDQAMRAVGTTAEGAATWPLLLASLAAAEGRPGARGEDSDAEEDRPGPSGRHGSSSSAYDRVLGRIEAAYVTLAPHPARGDVPTAMGAVLDLVALHRGPKAAEQLGSRILDSCAAPGLPVLRALAELALRGSIEEPEGSKARTAALARARRIVERSTVSYGAEPETWYALAVFELRNGRGDVESVAWRARKALPPGRLDEFEVALSSRGVR